MGRKKLKKFEKVVDRVRNPWYNITILKERRKEKRNANV